MDLYVNYFISTVSRVLIIFNRYSRFAGTALITGFDVYLKQAAVGVDNLGDPLRFDVFYGLPRSSAPTHYDEYLKRAFVVNAYMRSSKFCSCFGGTDVSVPYAAAMKTRYIFGMPRAAFPTTEDAKTVRLTSYFDLIEIIFSPPGSFLILSFVLIA